MGTALNDSKDMLLARKIAGAAAEKGGTAYYVGGFVRDRIKNKENKDVDIEVHGIRPAELEAILDSVGKRISIGESFGIYNIKGYSLDIAMPRKEENRGSGHKDFDVFVDPFIGTEKAAVRRDFTVNALMQNVLTGEVVDWFGGVKDIEDGIIRHINDKTFAEDELRVLRAAQFAARFSYTVAPETVELCTKMSLSSLPCERVMGELEKALLKADKPSVFFRVLRSMNQLSHWFPELENTIGIRQNPKHHSEGDVWVHTMMVLDEGARFRDKVKNPLGFMLACLTHDFGKAICTEEINGEIHSYMHETKGLPLIKAFMKRLTSERALTDYVLNLAELHMKPNTLAADKSSIKATNRMFDAALDPEALLCIATADGLGKIAQREYVPYDDFFNERLAIYREYMARPYVMGRDLIEAGLKPSKNFTKYLELAHNLRLSGVDKERVLKQILGEARKAGDIS